MGSKAQRRRRKLAIQRKTAPVDPIKDGHRWSRATVGPIPPGHFHAVKKSELAEDVALSKDTEEEYDDEEEGNHDDSPST